MPGRNSFYNYRYAYQGQEKDSETGKEAFELRLWDARIGRWLTTDPYGEFHSPYLGMGNNPLRIIDPDGGIGEDVIIKGHKSDDAVKELNKFSGFKIKKNEDGLLSSKQLSTENYNKLNADQKQVYDAINDHSVLVTIQATKPNNVVSFVGGAFLGNSINEKTGIVETRQLIDIDVLKVFDEVSNDRGRHFAHELVESYLGGLLSSRIGISSKAARGLNNEIYNFAHEKAVPQKAEYIKKGIKSILIFDAATKLNKTFHFR